MSETLDRTTYQQPTLFAADSLASHTVSPGSDEARQMTATSGRNIAALLPNSGPLGWLVKTLLASSQLSSTRRYLIWKVSATPQRRSVFQLVPLTPRTSGNESTLLPTVAATDWKGRSGKGHIQRHGNKRLSDAILYPTITASDATGGPGNSGRDGGLNLRTAIGGNLNPEWVEWFMGFPVGWTELER